MLTPFANEPILELRRAAVRSQLSDALAAVDRALPLDVPVQIGVDSRRGAELLSTDPGAPDRRRRARRGRPAPTRSRRPSRRPRAGSVSGARRGRRSGRLR